MYPITVYISPWHISIKIQMPYIDSSYRIRRAYIDSYRIQRAYIDSYRIHRPYIDSYRIQRPYIDSYRIRRAYFYKNTEALYRQL
jgi:hypothetical protein